MIFETKEFWEGIRDDGVEPEVITPCAINRSGMIGTNAYTAKGVNEYSIYRYIEAVLMDRRERKLPDVDIVIACNDVGRSIGRSIATQLDSVYPGKVIFYPEPVSISAVSEFCSNPKHLRYGFYIYTNFIYDEWLNSITNVFPYGIFPSKETTEEIERKYWTSHLLDKACLQYKENDTNPPKHLTANCARYNGIYIRNAIDRMMDEVEAFKFDKSTMKNVLDIHKPMYVVRNVYSETEARIRCDYFDAIFSGLGIQVYSGDDTEYASDTTDLPIPTNAFIKLEQEEEDDGSNSDDPVGVLNMRLEHSTSGRIYRIEKLGLLAAGLYMCIGGANDNIIIGIEDPEKINEFSKVLGELNEALKDANANVGIKQKDYNIKALTYFKSRSYGAASFEPSSTAKAFVCTETSSCIGNITAQPDDVLTAAFVLGALDTINAKYSHLSFIVMDLIEKCSY